MSVREVVIRSDGLSLVGLLHEPADEEGQRPVLIVLHGFGGSKDAPSHRLEAEMYASLGYAVLRFDFRGCGASEGRRGWIRCPDAVSDVRNALTWLREQPSINPERIAISGQSFGAAVGIYTAAIDERVAAMISYGGWGDGLSKFQRQHEGEAAWDRFTDLLAKGREKVAAGVEMMVSRWDIVPIPEHLRTHLPPGSIMEFPVEVAQSMADFRPIDVIARMAPRPLLLVHAAQDSVTPTDQSIDMMRQTGPGAELVLLSDMDHFPFANAQTRVRAIVRSWLADCFPLA